MHEKARQRLSRNGIRSGKGSRRYFALLLCPILLQMACGLGAVRETSPAVAPVVVVAGETLQGSILELDPPVAVFKGIPYAAPPVGERRWRPPRPASPRQGLQSAVEYGPSCVQDPDHVPDWYRYLAETFNQDPTLVPELGPISEDCL